MKTISFKSKTGKDGILKIEVPTGEKSSEMEVVLVIHKEVKTANTWPENFFKETYGCFKKTPIERPFQGEVQIREKIG